MVGRDNGWVDTRLQLLARRGVIGQVGRRRTAQKILMDAHRVILAHRRRFVDPMALEMPTTSTNRARADRQ